MREHRPRKPRKPRMRGLWMLGKLRDFVAKKGWLPSAPELAAYVEYGSRWTTWRDLCALRQQSCAAMTKRKWSVTTYGFQLLGTTPVLSKRPAKAVEEAANVAEDEIENSTRAAASRGVRHIRAPAPLYSERGFSHSGIVTRLRSRDPGFIEPPSLQVVVRGRWVHHGSEPRHTIAHFDAHLCALCNERRQPFERMAMQPGGSQGKPSRAHRLKPITAGWSDHAPLPRPKVRNQSRRERRVNRSHKIAATASMTNSARAAWSEICQIASV